MILVYEKGGIIYFRLILFYFMAWYRFKFICLDFDSNVFTKRDVIEIKETIISDLDKIYKL